MMRGKKQRRFVGTDAEIEVSMTPMIDVVFQLLIYFLVTFSTAEVLSFLDISRPAPDAAQSQQPPADMIRIGVFGKGVAINGREVSDEELSRLVARLAAVSKKQTVLVNCADESLHGRLINVLDLCAENGLTQIAVMSGK
ncbi:ExbD/TolR family protein [Pontiella agarivorans]|uniref:Biopolymer transporter ExbD n=1 Tax=Pontiella agarivorans TaxID=3038953 RepID=A0ABU5MV06_9BACT|nr:biopolymer transporter ExbD [Pontiella agarivorans]MDZ8117973.1 biopolymer transporter ExbD [Pontiella agarivorans]